MGFNGPDFPDPLNLLLAGLAVGLLLGAAVIGFVWWLV